MIKSIMIILNYNINRKVTKREDHDIMTYSTDNYLNMEDIRI